MVYYRLVFWFIGMVIGMVISLALDEILHHIEIVLSCQENMESLRAKVKSLKTIIRRLGKYKSTKNIEQRITTKLAVKQWVDRLRYLRIDASEMSRNSIVPRDVISRYKTSNTISKKISDIDQHLKLVPLIQLELLCWQLIQIRKPVHIMAEELDIRLDYVLHGYEGCAINKILRHIKIVFCFNRELEYLKDLVTSIRPIFKRIGQIPAIRIPIDTKPDAVAVWLRNMCQLIDEADKIECVPWWKVICRYKKSKQMTSLISDIDANVQLASVITLAPIFQGIKEVESQWQQSKRHWQNSSPSSNTSSQQNETQPEEEGGGGFEGEGSSEGGGGFNEDLGEREPLLGQTRGNLMTEMENID